MASDGYFDGPGPERMYHEFLKEGKFMIQRSKSAGTYVHYPRTINPATGEADLEWVAPSGNGTVYATTVNRQRPEKGGDYNIALIDLAEGPRMMSRVVGIKPEDVTVGMKVRAKVDKIGEQAAVVFEPAE
ncbi:MAG TPA: Zn-ribbon domain-containing OB-fold protein [Hyphomicrobiaceae bacterium]|nr:Zn-ribbon domain-containing OB-fold protein [Hyphomicrobiaceae bacterium]